MVLKKENFICLSKLILAAEIEIWQGFIKLVFSGCMSPAFVAMKAIDSNRNLMAAAAASVAPPFSFGSLHNSSTPQTPSACSSRLLKVEWKST